MKSPLKTLTLIALSSAALMVIQSPSAAQQSYRVIVHKDNQTESISKSDLSKYLLKKRSKWSKNGKVSVEPVDLNGDSDVREAFSHDVHGRSVANIKSYWQQQIFSGRGVPPPEVKNDAAVVAYVSTHRGAIGYVSLQASLSDVKVLQVSSG